VRGPLRWPATAGLRAILLGGGIGAAFTLAAAITLASIGYRPDGLGAVRASAPSWRGGSVPCRDAPMAHVREPSRFILVAKCVTVSGTVRSAHLDPAGGDLKIQLDLDSAYQRFLTPANQGLLTAAVIPTDQPSVLTPKPGQYLTLYGAWVQERILYGVGAVELHPCWWIVASEVSADQALQPISAPSVPPHVDLNQSLSVKVETPQSVPIGSPMPVSVSVQSIAGGAPKPAPAVALYVEVRAEQEKVVQWKAASANNYGTAKLSVLVSGPPGKYTLWVYAHKGVQGGIGRTQFAVTAT
jgi:hypothetical protein